MSETATLDKQLTVINNSIELFRTAPEILKDNRERSHKAVMVGDIIINQWMQAWNIKDEDERIKALSKADERSNKFLANCSSANKEMKEARSDITQMMTEFRNMFTEAENAIDKSKKNSIANEIQGQRNEYASELHKVEERKRKEAEEKAAKAQELIDIKSELGTCLSENFSAFLLKAKNWLHDEFNKLTLTDFEIRSKKIKNYDPILKDKVVNEFPLHISFNVKYTHNDVIHDINTSIKKERFPGLAERYKIEMEALRDELIDKLPSKLSELKEQKRLEEEATEAARKAKDAKDKAAREAAEKAAREAEEARKKAEPDRKAREQAEAEKMAREAKERAKKEAEEAELKKQGESTMLMFEKEAELADKEEAPESRKGYEIIVLHQAGYVQIFQMWFENEGKDLPVDKIGKTKMDSMKKWCEKYAHKTGEKIESKFLKYEESFKAVNRK